MSDSDLPESLQRFLRLSIPTFQAAELLLFLASHPERPFTAVEIEEGMKPTVISAAAIKLYLNSLKDQKLIEGEMDSGYRFAPASAELKEAVLDLNHAYNERPVTLIRTIYAIAESKIQSFADSFRLKMD
ncbi:MAG TPA: hypothetical protein VHY22_17250 [Chthoniobacteraceae bacterium]|nr:hypothetical protein [Chthoniobacteraceae bacterium]